MTFKGFTVQFFQRGVMQIGANGVETLNLLEDGLLRDVSSYLSMGSQMDDFSRGIVDSRRVVLDVTLVACCLFLCTRVVESWSTE